MPIFLLQDVNRAASGRGQGLVGKPAPPSPCKAYSSPRRPRGHYKKKEAFRRSIDKNTDRGVPSDLDRIWPESVRRFGAESSRTCSVGFLTESARRSFIGSCSNPNIILPLSVLKTDSAHKYIKNNFPLHICACGGGRAPFSTTAAKNKMCQGAYATTHDNQNASI